MWKIKNLLKKNQKIKRDIKEVYLDDINLNEYFLIDVRSVKEFKEGHLDGAINIPLFNLRKNINKINTDKKILVYCQTGSRSKRALKILEDSGIPNVYNLKGGMENI